MSTRTRMGCLFLALGLLLATVAGSANAQTLRIYHIDVDQGDSTLFVSPSGNTLLVDSGRNGDGDRIKAAMDDAGVTQIDHYVTTHYHADHYGGIDELVALPGVTVVQAYDRGDKQSLPSGKRNQTRGRYFDYDQSVGEDAIPIRRDNIIDLDPTMTVTCISHGGVVIGEDPPEPASDENDMSVTLLITFGGFRYFVGGDIHAHTEQEIADRDLVLDVDVYQANHHGSHTSSSGDFMRDLSPSVIVISNGNVGRFQHPRRVTLQTYASLPDPPTVFQTNKFLAGGSEFGNVPDGFIADLDTVGDEGTILITVDGAAGDYTVTYGTNTTHTFSIKAPGTMTSSIVIESLLPNPVGNDAQLEEVTVRNNGTAAVSLTGWVLRDRSNRRWSLTSLGSINAGTSETIQRAGMAMSLNNTGDEISLADSSGATRDTFIYDSSTEGARIPTGH